MWIFTTKGFVSIAQHKRLPEHFQVKARVSSPLQELWPDNEIEIIDWADYRFRITIEKKEVFPVMMQLLESLDYSNFKHECHEMKEYQSALIGVWTEMCNYQARMESD
jgi:hypothetical protein